jgi:hypothetical protein
MNLRIPFATHEVIGTDSSMVDQEPSTFDIMRILIRERRNLEERNSGGYGR